MRENVQIPFRLYGLMTGYIMDHAFPGDHRYHEIMYGIERKQESLRRHNLYSNYKTADTPESREQARKDYLDEVGMRDSFRW